MPLRHSAKAPAVALCLALCLGLGVGACSNQPSIASDASATAATGDGEFRGEIHSIPVIDTAGHTTLLQARVCHPAGDAPARLVVINHGSPANSAQRPEMKLGRCDQEAAEWFLKRRYVVVFALRRGYGATGGEWAEDYGGCKYPDYVAAGAGVETARDINAVVDYATALPFVRPDGAVVVGQSAGGWGTIAYGSLPHPKAAAFVVMAGGRGGHRNDVPNENCRPDLLVEAAGQFGKTATTPMLWIYTANDSYFAPPIARAMYQAFTTAGGTAELVQPGRYGDDGHHLFFGQGGSVVWGPLVEQYLSRQLAPAN